MQIPVTRISPDKARQKPADESTLAFGIHFSNHMFILDYEAQKGWHNPRVSPYGPFMLDPAAVVLHYAQEVFEGHKAYLCGPPPMIDAAITALMRGRLFERDIFMERFLTAADGADGASKSALFKKI